MPSKQPPTRVEKCPTCGHDREVVTSDEGTSYFRPAPPSEQPREGTRVKVVFTRAEAEALLLASDGYFSPDATNLGLGANKIAAALEPAQPQPRGEGDDLAARLESEVIGYSISLGLTESQCDLLHAAASRLRTSTEGGARPGDTPLNDTRTNSDRPWQEDVARAFVTNRPAQPDTPTEEEGT